MHLGQIIFKCGYKTIFYYYLFQEKSTRWWVWKNRSGHGYFPQTLRRGFSLPMAYI